MPSNHLILCRPLLLLPSIFPSIRVFSNESVLHIRWPKHWSFSFSISPSNDPPPARPETNAVLIHYAPTLKKKKFSSLDCVCLPSLNTASDTHPHCPALHSLWTGGPLPQSCILGRSPPSRAVPPERGHRHGGQARGFSRACHCPLLLLVLFSRMEAA